jgi:hypothetical protein
VYNNLCFPGLSGLFWTFTQTTCRTFVAGASASNKTNLPFSGVFKKRQPCFPDEAVQRDGRFIVKTTQRSLSVWINTGRLSVFNAGNSIFGHKTRVESHSH